MAILITALAYPLGSEAQIPPEERQALEALYFSTGGPFWVRKDEWLGPSGSECSEPGWFGVRCDDQGTHVVALELSANGLVGSLPPQIGNLSKLEILRLSVNSLTGTIPEALGSLRSLEGLYLDRNSLTGSIPEVITDLPSLSHLHLHRNRLSEPVPARWGNKSIRSVNLSTNSLSGNIPESLSTLPSLSELRLAGNKLSGPVPASFMQLSVASVIDLRWNALSVESLVLLNFLDRRSPDANVLSTQTLPPTDIIASTLDPGDVQFTWRPVSYTANEGGYRFTLKEPSGFEGRLPIGFSKTSSSFGILGLGPGDYSLTITTFTFPHAANANEVVSLPSAPVRFTITGTPPQPPAQGRIGFIPGFVQFFSVAEGERALVPVERLGGTNGAISVRARAVPGSAGPEDFVAPPQILSWGHGEHDLRAIEVFTVADDEVEGPEHISLILDQPQGGATLGPFSTASLEILDLDVSGFGSDPVAARDPEGNGLFVWIAPEGNDTTAVFGRFADPSGRPVGDSFQISEESPDVDESNPGVVSVKTDHFEVIWQHKRGAVRRCVIRIRGGADLGKQLPVASWIATDSLTVSGDPGSKRFGAAWASGQRILGRLFDENERPGPTLRIDGPQPGRPRRPTLAFDFKSKMGLFLWEQEKTGGDVDILGRLVGADGVPSGDEFQVNRETAGPQTLPQLTATRSGFFAVWRSGPLGSSEDPSGTELRGIPILAPRGETGVEFRINRDPIGSQDAPTITTDERGNCVIGWLREGAESNGLFLRTLRGCRNAGPSEKAVQVFRGRTVHRPRLFRAADGTGIVFGIVERDGGIGVETVRDEP